MPGKGKRQKPRNLPKIDRSCLNCDRKFIANDLLTRLCKLCKSDPKYRFLTEIQSGSGKVK